MTLSAKYVTYYIDEEKRKELVFEPERVNHFCHGFSITSAIDFVRDNGVPKEDADDARRGYSCVWEPPEQYPLPSSMYRIPAEVKATESNELKDLYRMLLKQPVGVNVHYFSPEFDTIGLVSNIIFFLKFKTSKHFYLPCRTYMLDLLVMGQAMREYILLSSSRLDKRGESSWLL